jgi:MFS transporter, DHA1 family, tetracycline resistance protein
LNAVIQKSETTDMKNKALLPIFLIVFVDLLGFSLILPLLPYYAKTFGATPLVTGLLVAIYAAAQLVGAPLLGRLSDRYGRRPLLLISIFGSFLGFLLLAAAEPLSRLASGVALQNGLALGLLFLSRLIDGLTGGNLSIAQAYISDVTDAKSRAQGLGLIGAAFGLGFIIGPAAGGALSQWGYAVPALAAAGLSLFNWLSVALRLPESLSTEKRLAIAKQPRAAFTLGALWRALQRPQVGPLLHTRFFFGLAFSLFQTIFALYALARFNLSSRDTGFILTYVGFLSVLVQGFAVGRLARRFSEGRLIFAMVALMTVSLVGWALAPNVPVLLIVLAPTSLAGGVLNTVINSALTKSVSPVEIGGTLGLAASLESLTRVISPTLGGLLLQNLGPAAPGLFAALVLAPLAFFVWRKLVAPSAATEAVSTPRPETV